MDKSIIRDEIYRLRSLLSGDDILSKSHAVCEAFYNKYFHLDCFLLYYSIRNEVNTVPLIERLYKENKRVYLPVVRNKDMIFKRFCGFDNMAAGAFGIPEPLGNELNEAPQIICVPGVAFDKECNRIGYGGGFYDRYMANYGQSAIKAGFAYEFQVIKNIDKEIFDEPVDEIFTEKQNIIRRI